MKRGSDFSASKGAHAPLASPGTSPVASKHVPALDGVRGTAILLVLFFHFMLISGNGVGARLIQKTWGYGWCGVDLFFVLSGFLITGILLDARKKISTAGRFYKNFYARRTVRIFPLYYAFLVVFLLVLPAAMTNFHDLFGWPPCGEWAYWTYTYNLVQGHHQSAKTFSHTMGVTWSLCIEEQFYLLWPTVVWFCKPRTLLKICTGLIAMSLIARALIAHYSGYEVFISQWTFARMDPLAIGASIAILTRIDPQRVKSLRRPAMHLVWIIPLALIALNAIVGSLLNSTTFLTVGFTSLAVLFGSVLLMTITSSPGGWYDRIFGNPVLRLFGRLSYAMYLFNQPVKIFLLRYVYKFTEVEQGFTRVPQQLAFFALATTLTVAAAWLSWHLFEKHFLKLKEWFPMDKPVTLANSSSAAAPMPAAP